MEGRRTRKWTSLVDAVEMQETLNRKEKKTKEVGWCVCMSSCPDHDRNDFLFGWPLPPQKW